MTGSLILIHSSAASRALPRVLPGAVGIYAGSDYAHYLALKTQLAPLEITDLSGRFHRIFEEIRQPVLEMSADLSLRLDSDLWWETHIASRNSGSTPLLRNLIVLFAMKEHLAKNSAPLVVVTDSLATMRCLAEVGREMGRRVRSIGTRRAAVTGTMRLVCSAAWNLIRFLWRSASRWLWSRLMGLTARRLPQDERSRVLIRSWVTTGTYGSDGAYTDRNFGALPAALRGQGIDVWTLPMFFNLPFSFRALLARMRRSGGPFVFPEQFLTLTDYGSTFRAEVDKFRLQFGGPRVLSVNIEPLLREIQAVQFLSTAVMELHLCKYLIRRLSQARVRIDAFYYPFENNTAEKPFLRAVRRWYPSALTVAYQHSIWPREQLGMFLSPREAPVHPMADVIVVGGPIYRDVLAQAGFPADRIRVGGNLRFTAVDNTAPLMKPGPGPRWRVLIPLTFEAGQGYELLHVIQEAIGGDPRYELHVRTHPLLKRGKLLAFMAQIQAAGMAFADHGSLQDQLRQADVVITNGSVVVLEAIALGVPVIRVRPANTFMYDPLSPGEYPFEPVEGVAGVQAALARLRTVADGRTIDFCELGARLTRNHFEPFRGDFLDAFQPVRMPV